MATRSWRTSSRSPESIRRSKRKRRPEPPSSTSKRCEIRELRPRNAKAGALDGAGDGGHVRPCGQTHLATLEVNGKRCRPGTGRGPGDGLHAAVAIHAGDLEDQFFSHVI